MNDISGVIQAIRGPLMLITLGSLVAIDYAGVYGFWRTWPILIIVFGLLKAAGASKREATAAVPSILRRQVPPGGNAI